MTTGPDDQGTTMHLTDDDLVLQYYGELSDADERRASAHLENCQVCHAKHLRLLQVLALVDAAPAIDAPDGFERTAWARVQKALPAKQSGLRWLLFSPARLAWTASIVALVAAAFFAGRVLPGRGGATPGASGTNAAQVRERILLVDLGDHLDRSQMMLIELVSAEGPDAGDITTERARAEQLLPANRLYRQTAADAGDAQLAAVLDELERVLVDVSAGPSRLSASDLEAVRSRIESHGLLFKVQVLSSEVEARERAVVQRRAGQRS